jgi:DNA modification methylase
MVALFAGVRRVLRGDGTLWLNVGDCYAGSWSGNSMRPNGGTQRPGKPGFQALDSRYAGRSGACGFGTKPKDLMGMPWRLAFALQADGWWLRSDIIWSKPNPMPESVTDRPTKSHEYVFLLSKSATYYYDAAAIAEPAMEEHAGRYETAFTGSNPALVKPGGTRTHPKGMREWKPTRNARTVWEIATQPYPQAHFATFPDELARRCILAGSSNKACEQCGAPWERVVAVEYVKSPVHGAGSVVGRHYETGANNWDGAGLPRVNKKVTTTGWQPTCSCKQEGTGRCIVLDPFGGSGTVAKVATGNGRDSIYIDLNPAYLEMAKQRIGPMLCEQVVA